MLGFVPPAKNTMGDLGTTTPELILGGTPSVRSSRMMQGADASTWPSMGSNLPDGHSATKLAPMAAAWRPIFASDVLAFKRNPTSDAISFGIHAVLITLVLLLAVKAHTIVTQQPTPIVTPVDLEVPIPPIILPVAKAMGGGGGAVPTR